MYSITSCRNVPFGHAGGAVQLSPIETVLTDAEVETICRQLGHSWRVRIFPPAVIVRSMVYRSLHPDKSIKGILADLAAADDRLDVAPTDAAWCQARSRLPEGLWRELIGGSTRRVTHLAGDRFLYVGRAVYLVDGSTLSMPDTPELVDAFGYAKTKHGLSRFPVARITFVLRAGVEALCDYRLGRYRQSESAQLHAMWHGIPRGSIVIWDRYFCSFYNLAKCRQRRVDVISCLHQRRDARDLIADGKSIGKNEWLVWLDLAPQLRKKYDDPSLPQRLCVRLIRVVFNRKGKRRQIWLVTTLLDPKRYTRNSIVKLYRRRWGIETRIGSLKTTLEMNVLRSHSPQAVRSEVAATVLAHNLTWTLIHQAAQHTNTPPDRISFAGAVKAILAYSPALRNAPAHRREHIYRRMLRHIANHTNLYRPGRTEPRLIKRDRRRYGFLKIPRDQARELCLS